MITLGLLTCIVLRAFSAQAKVSDDFECKEFFYKEKEPTGLDQNAKKICQWTAKRIYYYATLYSVHHRIPLYSAYIFDSKCLDDSGRPKSWHLEPQISQPDSQDIFMVKENKDNKNLYKQKQATTDDYSGTGYDIGHLYPNSFQCKDGRMAANTLTNAAPMDSCFNRIQWAKREKALRILLKNMLDDKSTTVFIVTGTVPSATLKIPQKEISKDPERVTVPSHIWTAVCYKHSDDRRSFSFGYIGENVPEERISTMTVSALNHRLSGLYSELSGTPQSIKIFVDDCFSDNSKSKEVQIEFLKKVRQPGNQRLQSSDMQNTFGALKRVLSSDSISAEINVKVSKLTANLAFDSMSSYYNVAEKLKALTDSACLIKPFEMTTMHNELRKRDVPNAVECVLVPEKQMTAADGSPCQKVIESSDSCQCYLGAKTKPCCSSPCLYSNSVNSYRCYSGQTLIECSPRYSLVSVNGERCLDEYPCATYGYDYYWCWTGASLHHWDHCSPPLWKSKAANGQYCLSNHACAKYRARYRWCYTADGSNDYCCTSDDCFSTVTDKTCRPNHPCGYHGYTYLWCYTDDQNNSAKCCKNCSQ